VHDSDLIEYQGGEVLASLTERTVTGLLIPFNELGHTNAGRFMVEAGAVALPSDPSVISLNLDHDRSQNVGRASRVWEEPNVGIMATFLVATTPEGDAYLADVTSPAPKRKCLSGEFHTAIQAGKAVPGSGRLWGAGGVERGAFPSAMVLAEDRSTSSKYVTEYTDAEGVVWRRVEQTDVTVTETETGTESTSVTTVTETTEGEPTVPDPIVPVAAQAAPVAPAPVAPVPATVLAGLPGSVTTPITTAPVNETAAVLAALSTLRFDRRNHDAMEVLAAIADITMSGANALPGANVLRPSWLGKLYQGVPYAREYIQLGNLGTDITAAGKLGMRVIRGTNGAPLGPQDGSWFGNKNAIGGYRGDSNTIASLLYRFALGNDIDRALYDLPGGAEVVEEFLQLVIEDGLIWSDRIARETYIATAGAPVAPKAYPAIYATNGTTALAMLIQGILAVKKRKSDGRRDVPTFAVVNDIAFEQLAYAAGGDQNLPAFINLQLAALTEAQSAVGAIGPVNVVNGDTGVQATASVVVGSQLGVDFDELPGGPVLIDAVDLARGGIDKATHAYLQTYVKRPEAFVHVGAADNWAAGTPVAWGTPIKNGAGILQAQPSATLPVGSATAGTTGGSAPTNPAVGATVVDGTVTWRRLA
jgi:hypothetical protein